MGIVFKRLGKTQTVQEGGKRCCHSKPLPIQNLDLNQPGRLRVGHLMTLFSVSHSSIYKRLADGRIPPPDGRDPRLYWLTSTIRDAVLIPSTSLG
jgi:predicted DNA-binding transcriptional regulator AlpA